MPFLKHLLDKDLCNNFFEFHIYIGFFLAFSNDYVIYIDFTHVEASNTASDDVINWVTYTIFNTNA